MVTSGCVEVAPDPFRLVGTLLDGKYRVDRAVGQGGFAVVYAGHHVRLNVPLAIKVLKPSTSRFGHAEAVSRFLTEAQTMARLSHPHIARVFDAGVSAVNTYPEALAWIALEWLDGETLEADLDRRRGRGGRRPREAWQLLKPVLEALAYAHQNRVAHRDLKPSNVMLVPAPQGVSPKVLDFGIAKLLGAEESSASGYTSTQSGVILFSPGYAAPEQISRTRTGPWTDVHALGLLFTEVLVDHPAYANADTPGVFASVLDTQRPTPSRHGVRCGPWEEILARALARVPAERHQSAGELLRDLEATLYEAEAQSQASGPAQEISFSATQRLADGVTERLTNPASDSGADSALARTGTTLSSVSGNYPRSAPPPSRIWVGAGLGVCGALLAAYLLFKHQTQSSAPETSSILNAATPVSHSPAVPTAAPSATSAPLEQPALLGANAATASAKPEQASTALDGGSSNSVASWRAPRSLSSAKTAGTEPPAKRGAASTPAEGSQSSGARSDRGRIKPTSSFE